MDTLKFKEGDKVRITSPEDSYNGQTGVVIDNELVCYDYCIEFEDGTNCLYDSWELAPLEVSLIAGAYYSSTAGNIWIYEGTKDELHDFRHHIDGDLSRFSSFHVNTHFTMLNPEPVAQLKENTHYDAGGIETIDFIKAKLTKDQLVGGFLFNILKYAGRFNFKHDDPLADAKKIRDYAQQLVDTLTPN